MSNDTEKSHLDEKVVLSGSYSNNQFYPEIDNFRSISILFIIAAHCWAYPIFIFNSWMTGKFGVAENLKVVLYFAEVLFHSSTLFFAIISGLLFTLVLKSRGWKTFYLSKIKYVALPYIIITFAYTYWGAKFNDTFSVWQNVQGVMEKSVTNILTGGAFFHLWYIPVLMAIFALTPIFAFIQRTPALRVVKVLIVVSPIVISRIWPEFSWKTVVYFSAAYMVGIWAGAHYQRVIETAMRHRLLILCIFAVTSITNYYFYQVGIKYWNGINIQESIFYLQKLSMALVIVSILKDKNVFPFGLNMLATYGFTIYLVHAYFIRQSMGLISQFNWMSLDTTPIILFGFAFLLLAPVCSIMFTLIVKKLVGRYSRVVIGS